MAKTTASPPEDRGGRQELAFQAEVAKLLHLMVHSVYSEREVFLRELISNAADACDKLRYEAIARPELLQGPDLAITIAADKTAKTLTISDTGIGMSREELVDNLGTIARSGTQAFLDRVKEGQNDIRLIGQFGIGFYSAFIVAARVEVVSRRAGEATGWKWTSEGTGSFTVEEAPDAPARGTQIRLELKDDAAEFLDAGRLEDIVRTYSDHVAHPIMLRLDHDTTRQINTASAIWARPKSDVTAEQHKEFLAGMAGIFSDPAITLHYRAEGRNEYTVLLYVPSERPFDLFDPERKGRQRLYVRRVFITDDADILPAYLRFVRGVIDSEDMPLNISREMLQNNPTVAQIRKAVTNRVLGELKKCADSQPETFNKVWDAFGAVIKEGLYEDMERRDQIYEIARFRTTRGEHVSLKDYVERLVANQTAIFYLTAEDAAKAKASPQLEGFAARGIEVLLLTDPVDTFWVRTALGFEGKPFKSITQGSAELDLIPLPETPPLEETDDKSIAVLVAAMKQTLGEAVKEVRRSTRLTDSPVCLIADALGLDRTLERLLARQGQPGAKAGAPILEINPHHAIIRSLAQRVTTGGVTGDVEDTVRLLLDEAFILEGEALSDPAGFARRLSDLMQRTLETDQVSPRSSPH
ncbi:MAG TPA: molecular chaperone HtpG [Aestuariivirgaceae bacterium]|nr:molecular chaperone HtpG [Aestuariivirgaceae bacterium]